MVFRHTILRHPKVRMDNLPLKPPDQSFNGKPKATAFRRAAQYTAACGLPLNEPESQLP